MKKRGIKITNIEKEAKKIVESIIKTIYLHFPDLQQSLYRPEVKRMAIDLAKDRLEMIVESNPTTVYDEKDFCNKMYYLNLIDVIREL